MNDTRKERDTWSVRFNHLKKFKQGDYIAVPLTILGTYNFYDLHNDAEMMDEGVFPFTLTDSSDINEEEKMDYLLILQNLGNNKFLELISGSVITSQNPNFGEEFAPTYPKNAEEFQQLFDFVRDNPLCINGNISCIEDYIFDVDDEVKMFYAQTSLKNQDYIRSTLDELKEEARERLDNELKSIVVPSAQEEAEIEDVLVDANNFISSHSRRI